MKYIPGDARRKLVEWGKHDPADPDDVRRLLLRVMYLHDDERGQIYHPPKIAKQLEGRWHNGKIK